MTRKDYKVIAEVIKFQGSKADPLAVPAIRELAQHLAIELKKDNPRFREDYFFLASGII